MNELEKACIIDPSALSESDYFSSLTEAAYTSGLFSVNDLQNIQSGLISIIKRQIDKYTNGDSASVRTEIAQSLAESAVYTLGLAAKAYSPDDAVLQLRQVGVERLFFNGQKKILRKVSVLRASAAILKKRLFKTDSICYNELPKVFEDFIKEYDPEFEAQGVFDTVYPTFMPIKNLSGIEFAEKYMTYISYENSFLKLFGSDDISEFMKRYDRSYNIDPVNIFEPVFSNSIARALCGYCDGSIFITKDDLTILKNRLSGKSHDDIFNEISGALASLFNYFSVDDDSGFAKYLLGSCNILAGTVFEAVKINRLDRIFHTFD